MRRRRDAERATGAERAGDAIRDALAGLGGESSTTAVERVWAAAVGPGNAVAARPSRLARDGTLHVATRDSTWAFQLGLLAPEILANLRRELGASAPKALKFAAGPLAEVSRTPAPPRVEPSAEERAQAQAYAAGIDDERLREEVARAAAASLARARASRPL